MPPCPPIACRHCVRALGSRPSSSCAPRRGCRLSAATFPAGTTDRDRAGRSHVSTTLVVATAQPAPSAPGTHGQAARFSITPSGRAASAGGRPSTCSQRPRRSSRSQPHRRSPTSHAVARASLCALQLGWARSCCECRAKSASTRRRGTPTCRQYTASARRYRFRSASLTSRPSTRRCYQPLRARSPHTSTLLQLATMSTRHDVRPVRRTRGRTQRVLRRAAPSGCPRHRPQPPPSPPSSPTAPTFVLRRDLRTIRALMVTLWCCRSRLRSESLLARHDGGRAPRRSHNLLSRPPPSPLPQRARAGEIITCTPREVRAAQEQARKAVPRRR